MDPSSKPPKSDRVDGIRVRQAVASDVAALADLVALFAHHTGETPPAIPTSLSHLLGDPNTDFLVAFAPDGGALGYAQLRTRYSLWLAAPEAELEDLFVRDAARGAGVGAALLAAAIECTRARGGLALLVSTNEANTVALSVYRRAGFVAERRRWNGRRQLMLRRDLEQRRG